MTERVATKKASTIGSSLRVYAARGQVPDPAGLGHAETHQARQTQVVGRNYGASRRVVVTREGGPDRAVLVQKAEGDLAVVEYQVHHHTLVKDVIASPVVAHVDGLADPDAREAARSVQELDCFGVHDGGSEHSRSRK